MNGERKRVLQPALATFVYYKTSKLDLYLKGRNVQYAGNDRMFDRDDDQQHYDDEFVDNEQRDDYEHDDEFIHNE